MAEEGEVLVENVEETAPATEQQAVGVEETSVETPSTEGVVQEEVDEHGVSWKNRAMEYQRKHNKLAQEVGEIKQKIVQPQVEQEYSIADLEKYAELNPEQRPLVEQEKERIRQKEMMSLLDERDQRLKSEQQAEQQRINSLNYVKTNYPDLFSADGSFNYTSPLFVELDTIMADPRINASPDGLQIAADLAFGRLARKNMGSVATKLQQKEDENRALQRSTFVEGSGTPAPSVSPHQKVLSKVRETGTVKDGAKAMGSILRSAGILSDE